MCSFRWSNCGPVGFTGPVVINNVIFEEFLILQTAGHPVIHAEITISIGQLYKSHNMKALVQRQKFEG